MQECNTPLAVLSSILSLHIMFEPNNPKEPGFSIMKQISRVERKTSVSQMVVFPQT